MRALWEKEGESRGEKTIRAGVPLAGKVSPFPASFPFGKEHPFHVGVGEARVGGKFDVPGTADDAEGAFGVSGGRNTSYNSFTTDLVITDALTTTNRYIPAIYTLLSTLGNGVQLAAALGVWAMVFLSVAIIGAAVIGGKRGGLFKV